ncbi:Ger(x)C family spore germination protein [Litchfieldia alkalitelluris]|uniref:Ger(x)C family spore germination protein n=1 Tax=Litchfieldia alkalitelluris TaxID=304268 RepID=UPI00099800DE|nr:Ger(x)C family spore germination protein [Litchfieldia alkalitelluris]
MRFLKIMLPLFFILLLVGCGFKDIDKRFFVVSIGIDKPENDNFKYNVLLKLAIPEAEPKMGAKKFILISEEANSITEAVRIMKSRVDKELDFGHAKTIVLGEELFEKDIKETMDWFVRRRDIQNVAWVTLGSPTAKAVLELKPDSERLPSNALLLAFGDQGTETPYITSVFLFKFIRDLNESGINPVLPIVEMGKEKLFMINRLVILEEGKEKLRLNKDETKTFNILDKGYDKTDILVDEEDEKFLISVQSLSSNFKVDVKNQDEPSLQINIKLSGIVEESQNMIDLKTLNRYEKLVSKASTKRVKDLILKFQEEKVDPLGFGLRYRATHSGEESAKYKKWLELYPKLQINVNVEAKIEGTGIITSN